METTVDVRDLIYGTYDRLENKGDSLKITGIAQNLPPEAYHPLRARRQFHIKDRERDLGVKLRVSVPTDKWGKRFVRVVRWD